MSSFFPKQPMIADEKERERVLDLYLQAIGLLGDLRQVQRKLLGETLLGEPNGNLAHHSMIDRALNTSEHELMNAWVLMSDDFDDDDKDLHYQHHVDVPYTPEYNRLYDTWNAKHKAKHAALVAKFEAEGSADLKSAAPADDGHDGSTPD